MFVCLKECKDTCFNPAFSNVLINHLLYTDGLNGFPSSLSITLSDEDHFSANIDFLSSRFEYSYSKLEGTHTSSLDIRLTSIIAGVKVGFNHFFVGAGIDKGAAEMEAIFKANGLVYDQTSTPAAFFAMFGFFFAMILTVFFIRSFALSIKTKKIAIFVVVLGILLSISNERFIFELTYYIFFAYGCMPKSSFESYNKLELN